MRYTKSLLAAVAVLAFAGGVVTLPTAGEDPEKPRVVGKKKYGQGRIQTTDQIMVRLKDPDAPLELARDGSRRMVLGRSQVLALSRSAVTELAPVRQMSSGTHVLRLSRALPVDDVQAIAARIANDPAVAHAEPDARRYPMQTAANDTRYNQQWSLFESTGGINVEAAWVTTRGAGIRVAVLDTGVVLTNPDLTARLLPGMDMVGADPLANLDSFIQARYGIYATANDGDGRDGNPSDPGNWVAADEAGKRPFADCPSPTESDWHGTHISGIVAATRNNSYGVAGIAPEAQIIPVRVLGKCGGYTSDIIDGIRWAAGVAGIAGVTANNATPAHVINLSLGGVGTCSTEEQNAINAALAGGTVKAIVAAAGNDGLEDAGSVSPANCAGVLAVAATDRNGSRAPYTNIGTNIAVSAPGGCFAPDCSAQPVANGIMSLFNTGTTVPLIDGFAWVIGTSEAAAHVSGIAALMVAANAAITPTQLSDRIRSSARPFADCSCTSVICGNGLVDAGRAVLAAAGGTPSTLTGATCAGSATIIGAVYVDTNGNSTLDTTDDGIAGVTISLQTAAGAPISSTTTNDIGNYAFVGLAAGTYRVVKTQPAGGSGTLANVGTVGGVATGTASANTISGITITSTSFAKGYNFGLSSYTPPSSGGGGGGGGGGCTIGGDGRPDGLLAMLALIALAGVARRSLRKAPLR